MESAGLFHLSPSRRHCGDWHHSYHFSPHLSRLAPPCLRHRGAVGFGAMRPATVPTAPAGSPGTVAPSIHIGNFMTDKYLDMLQNEWGNFPERCRTWRSLFSRGEAGFASPQRLLGIGEAAGLLLFFATLLVCSGACVSRGFSGGPASEPFARVGACLT
jgi:hypothetical protein